MHKSGGTAPNDPAPNATTLSATLHVAAISNQRVLVTANDFAAAGVERSSPVHTKNVISVEHTDDGGVQTTAAYYQVDENVLAVKIKVVSSATTAAHGGASVSHVAVVLGLDSGMQLDDPKNDTFTTSILAAPLAGSAVGSMLQCEGIASDWAIALAAPPTGDAKLAQHAVYGSVDALRAGLFQQQRRGGFDAAATNDVGAASTITTSSKQLYAALIFSIPAGGSTTEFTVVMARSAPSPNGNEPNTTIANIAAAITPSPTPAANIATSTLAAAMTTQYTNQWNRRVAEDASFWSGAIKLEGAWPETWKRGFVYDLNTVRANIRPAVGVFKHPWDAMQVHGPRIVAAESSMDTMVLSYVFCAPFRESNLPALYL